MIVIAFITLLGIGGLALMAGQLRKQVDSAGGSLVAEASLQLTLQAAQEIAAGSSSFANADHVALSGRDQTLTYVPATDASTSPTTVSVSAQSNAFVATASTRS